MNERISEIWDQAAKASALLRAGENSWETQKAFIEKFAELIVEKCAGIIESQDVDPSFKLRMSWAVKQYFGVEQ